MKIFEIIDRLFNDAIVKGSLLAFLLYISIVGILRIAQHLRAHRLNVEHLDVIKKQLDIVETAYRIENFKNEYNIKQTEMEKNININHMNISHIKNYGFLKEEREEISIFFQKYIIKNGYGNIYLIFSNLLFKIAPISFILFFMFVGWFSPGSAVESTHWDAVFIIVLICILLIHLSIRTDRIAKAHNVRNILRFVSYPVALALCAIIYIGTFLLP